MQDKRGPRNGLLFNRSHPQKKPELISRFEDFTRAKVPMDGLYFVPLGGTGEFGLNLNVYYCDGKWLIVDLGVSFDGSASINVFMPKVEFLHSIPKEDIVGIVITHGHEDHLGAVQYLWHLIKRPVYATPFTKSLLEAKLKDAKTRYESDLHLVQMRDRIQLGPFDVQWVSVTHSIPDNSMILIRTKYGNVLHTGDWRFDDSPVVGEKSDLPMLEEFGKEGVLAVVGDSTNAMTEGKFASEEDVKQSLEALIKSIKTGRIVVVCFSTNVSRVKSCGEIGQRVNRKVALVGRSLHRINDIAKKEGLFKTLPEFITEDMVRQTHRDQVLIVCTGSQGEPHSGLRRLSDNEHPKITLEAGDTVIISARMITGKEKDINDMLNKLAKRGINTITTKQDADIHVSGHPPQEDLRKLYQIVRPAIGVPVHGEVRNLIAHRDLFKSMGIKSELLENGDFVKLTELGVKKVCNFEVGQLGLDGVALIPKDGTVLMERAWLGGYGCVFANVLVLNQEEFQFNITTFGVVEHQDHRFKNTLNAEVETLLRNLKDTDRFNEKQIISLIRNGLQTYIFRKRRIDPKIFVNVFTPNQSRTNFIEETTLIDDQPD